MHKVFLQKPPGTDNLLATTLLETVVFDCSGYFCPGLSFDRAQRKPQRPKPAAPTEKDRKKYAEDAEKFANSLVEGLNDPDGELFRE